jgi:PD-(D/E)XK nuclease superfamily
MNPAEFAYTPPGRKPQVHYSALGVLWRCGIAFMFRYLYKVRSSPPSVIHVGRAVDTAANINLESKIKTDVLLPTEHVMDIARDATRELFDKEGVTPSPNEPTDPVAVCDLAVDKAVNLAKAHSIHLAPKLKPRAVQVAWAMEISGFDFDVVGTRDLDETDGTIRDLKTSKKSPKRDAAWTSDQGTLYTMSRYVINQQPPPVPFALDTIVETPVRKQTRVVTLTSSRDTDDWRVMAARIENAAEIIHKETFTPARQDDWWCSLDYCEFATRCPFFRRPKSFVLGEPEA